MSARSDLALLLLVNFLKLETSVSKLELPNLPKEAVHKLESITREIPAQAFQFIDFQVAATFLKSNILSKPRGAFPWTELSEGEKSVLASPEEIDAYFTNKKYYGGVPLLLFLGAPLTSKTENKSEKRVI